MKDEVQQQKYNNQGKSLGGYGIIPPSYNCTTGFEIHTLHASASIQLASLHIETWFIQTLIYTLCFQELDRL